ncbi:hypothetical protein XELAEV_18012498mg [Xenopus laevis]|uniref:GIY-YIG domain-containing protein n=1 Tax=Xenopus laevis TaxID=8355 RepID=A0A974DMP8_XENLA|nr:hypothetical protein XELAEV_18012498mg [Xenopus laevis]
MPTKEVHHLETYYVQHNLPVLNKLFEGKPKNHPLRGGEIPLKMYATYVYVLKCPCGMLYVGKTIRPVNTRIQKYKNSIQSFEKDSHTDTPVSRHFFNNKHSACQLKWKVLEVVQKPIRGGDWKNLLLQGKPDGLDASIVSCQKA